jgi:hypothetical protein
MPISCPAEAHRKPDAAVFAAYGWPVTLTDAELLERLLALNHQRAGVAAGAGSDACAAASEA